MRSQCSIRHTEAIAKFAVSNDDNFFGKPLSSEKNGELVAWGGNDDEPFPRVATATAFNTCKLSVQRLQGREADKAASNPPLDLFTLIVVATNSAFSQKHFITAGNGDDVLPR